MGKCLNISNKLEIRYSAGFKLTDSILSRYSLRILNMIMVQSTFQLLPESKAQVLKLMKNMVRLCRQEHGCLNYEYFEGVTDSSRVILVQEWENAECLQGHYQTEHMQDFISKLGEHLESDITTRSYYSQEESAVTPQTSDELPAPEQIIH